MRRGRLMGCCGGSYLTGGETRRDHVVVVVVIPLAISPGQVIDSLFLCALQKSLGDNSDID